MIHLHYHCRCFQTNCHLRTTTKKIKINLAILSNQCIKHAITSKSKNPQSPTKILTAGGQQEQPGNIIIIVQIYWMGFAPRLFGPKASNPPTSPRPSGLTNN
jgi:hypothetical protein